MTFFIPVRAWLIVVLVLGGVGKLGKVLFDRMTGSTSPTLAFRKASRLPSDQRSAFFLCTFSLLAKLSLADGELSPPEQKRIQEYIESELDLPFELEELALKIFEEALASPLDYRDYVLQFKKSFPDRIKLFSTLISLLIDVSASDGTISKSEDDLLRSIVLLLDFTEPHYELMKAKYALQH